MTDDTQNRGGRPATHGAYLLMRRVDGGQLDPALARELSESARELLADDGPWENQPRRRQRLAHRLACLELYLDSIDGFVLQQGSVFLPEGTLVSRGKKLVPAGGGEPLPLFKLYVSLINAYRRTVETLGLEAKRTGETPNLEAYLRERAAQNGTQSPAPPEHDPSPAPEPDRAPTANVASEAKDFEGDRDVRRG